MFNRFDANGNKIQVNDLLLHYTGKMYKVIFSEDIQAYGIISIKDNMFDFMSDWEESQWEILK